MNKQKSTWRDIFRELPPDEDESHSATRYAWQGYTPSRKEWMQRKHHYWLVEFLAPWIVLGPALLLVILVLLFVW